MDNKFLTCNEVAKRWNVSIQTIYNRLSIRAAMPPSVKIGKIRRFPEDALHTWEVKNTDIVA